MWIYMATRGNSLQSMESIQCNFGQDKLFTKLHYNQLVQTAGPTPTPLRALALHTAARLQPKRRLPQSPGRLPNRTAGGARPS